MKVPTVEINDTTRTVLCDSKVKIEKYDISKHQHIYQIRIYFPIDDGLLRLILTKCASIIGLKYKCDNCILEVEGNEKTIAITKKLSFTIDQLSNVIYEIKNANLVGLRANSITFDRKDL